MRTFDGKVRQETAPGLRRLLPSSLFNAFGDRLKPGEAATLFFSWSK
jgi:hypothetical protein